MLAALVLRHSRAACRAYSRMVSCYMCNCDSLTTTTRENVEEATDGLTEAKYRGCMSESEAREVYERALLQPGKVRVLD